MFLYVYMFNGLSGEITEAAVKVRETPKMYKAESGYIPVGYISAVRKAEMPYIGRNTYVSTKREPEAARKLFLDNVERRYAAAIEEAKRMKALRTAAENCQIKETEP